MRFATLTRTLGLTIVGLCSFLVSSFIVQATRACPQATPPIRDVAVKVPGAPIVTTGDSRPGDAKQHSRSHPPLARHALRLVSIQVKGDKVRIAAAARMYESRPNRKFVWSARVVDPSNEKVLFERRYDHQMFVLDAGVEFEPTFADTFRVPLPPRSYRVEAMIYKVQPNGGFSDGPQVSRLMTLGR